MSDTQRTKNAKIVINIITTNFEIDIIEIDRIVPLFQIQDGRQNNLKMKENTKASGNLIQLKE